ncbi:MAG: hypothetical protein ACP5K5_03515 [Candidatus Micrarchaeia archaeon]
MRSRIERELSVWVDTAMERIGNMEGDGILSDEEAIDRRMREIDFRDNLVEATVSMIEEAVRCKKIAESLKRAGMEISYELGLKVSADSAEKIPSRHAP